MEKEAEEDEDVYEAMGCWCETNDKAKTKAIADGDTAINRLTAAIEDHTANSARLNTEISNLEKEVQSIHFQFSNNKRFCCVTHF